MDYNDIQEFFKAQHAAGLKRCSMCNKWKDKEEYHKFHNGLKSECKECASVRKVVDYAKNGERDRARRKIWYAKNKDAVRAARFEDAYDMTLGQLEEMFKKQGRVCALCKSDNPHGKYWHTDHKPGTKIVRGILCQPCNMLVVGVYEKRILPKLEQITEYLNREAKK